MRTTIISFILITILVISGLFFLYKEQKSKTRKISILFLALFLLLIIGLMVPNIFIEHKPTPTIFYAYAQVEYYIAHQI